MKASLLLAPGTISPLENVPTPKPGPGELLIRVKAALTCGTDLKAFLRGHPMIPMPGPFGHEFSGIVERTGSGVRKFKKGDEIMSVHSAPCLRCPYCKKGLHNLCDEIMSTKVLGAFAEYLVIPSHVVRQNTFIKPPGLSFEEAALLEPLACVVHGLEPLSITKKDTALVLGGGPIGLMHVMMLKAHGATVVMADPHAGRLNMAKNLGAKHAIRLMPDRGRHRQQTLRATDKLTGKMGFDYVFECTGRPEVWEASVDYARRGGTVTLFGGCPSGTTACFDTHRLHYDEITLRGDFHFTPADVKVAYEILRDGKLKTREFISGSFPLKHIQKAFDLLQMGKGVKYAILP